MGSEMCIRDSYTLDVKNGRRRRNLTLAARPMLDAATACNPRKLLAEVARGGKHSSNISANETLCKQCGQKKTRCWKSLACLCNWHALANPTYS